MNELEHPTGDPYGAKDGKDLISGITVFPMEPHVPRKADIDPKAAIRAERQVATMFGLSSLMIILFIVAYIQVPADLLITIPVIGTLNANHLAIGFTFGMAILLIGLGAIHWAKKLMPDEEVIQERHALTSSNEERAAVQSSLQRGAAESGFKERKIIRRSLLGALALFPVPLIVLLRDLGKELRPGRHGEGFIYRCKLTLFLESGPQREPRAVVLGLFWTLETREADVLLTARLSQSLAFHRHCKISD